VVAVVVATVALTELAGLVAAVMLALLARQILAGGAEVPQQVALMVLLVVRVLLL
jgi:hypothetical protein